MSSVGVSGDYDVVVFSGGAPGEDVRESEAGTHHEELETPEGGHHGIPSRVRRQHSARNS
jgi:hypothetical protein